MDQFLELLGASSLSQLAQSLPSPNTTALCVLDAQSVLEEIRSSQSTLSQFEEQNLQWQAFHLLSQSHSTLYHHRYQQKALRQTMSCKRSKSLPLLDSPDNQHPVSEVSDTKELVSILPEDWTVVLLTVGETSESCRAQLQGTKPSHFDLHMCRVTGGTNSTILTHTFEACNNDLITDLCEIREKHVLINKSYRDPMQYSSLRDKLDIEMKRIMLGMEAHWLGAWQGLLVGHFRDFQKVFKLIEKLVMEFHLSHNQIYKLTLLVCSPCVQLSKQDASAPHSLRVVIAKLVGESVRSQKVLQIEAALAKEEHRKLFLKARNYPRGHLVFIFDRKVEFIPWEAMTVLQKQSVTRMPCLHCLHTLYLTHRDSSVFKEGVDCSKGYYVLDPENNLQRTRERLGELIKETKWQGVTAKKPTHEEIKCALLSKDLFIYIGHGSGSQYLPGDMVEELLVKPLVLLYGCSSVRLQNRGRVPDPWGVLYNYLLAKCSPILFFTKATSDELRDVKESLLFLVIKIINCPCVMGMLYEVTDKDTDNLTKEMLLTMKKAREGSLLECPSLPSIVVRSRPVCNRYLTFAACVLYGLPLKLKLHS